MLKLLQRRESIMSSYRTNDRNDGFNQKSHWLWAMAIPLAFANGLYFGGYALRKIRQHWEGGPMD